MSIVEDTLRTQRDCWREIAERVSSTVARDLPMEAPKRILMFGLGSSHYAARLAATAVIRDRLRTRIPVIGCPSISIGTEYTPQKGDWVFAFSHRAGPGPTIQALNLAHQMGAMTVLVCGKGAPAPESAQYVLETVPLEKVEPHTTAVSGAICAVTTLMLGQKGVEEWEAVCSIGDPDLDLMRRRAGEGPSVLLGEWEGQWLAREGALKLMEMARLPVRSYSTEEFFHGPQHAMGEGDRIWHVSMPKDPREEQLRQGRFRAAHTIGVFGSSPLAWVPALVELQWLALAVALNRGVDPDLGATGSPD